MWLDDRVAKKAVNQALASAGYSGKYVKDGHYTDWRKGDVLFRVHHTAEGHAVHTRAIERVK